MRWGLSGDTSLSAQMDIDFVIPWVDGADPDWIAEKNHYLPIKDQGGDSSEARFRDWGLMRYWFRGIEQNAPWVRRIFFVTWGHLPNWLNTSHPKLRIVRHEEFIPEAFLPTFNSNVLDWNLFRIKELSENFVLFNDDTFLISKTDPTDFFNDRPCGAPVLEPYGVVEGDWFYTPVTNCAVVNKYFDLHKAIRKNPFKWISPKYGIRPLLSTLLMLPFPRCYGFRCWHLPNSFHKSTFKELWDKEESLLTETCLHRFRDKTEPNQWLAEYWQYLSGDFQPRNPNFGKLFHLGQYQDEFQQVIDYIAEQKGKSICINDAFVQEGLFDELALKLQEAFQVIFPEPSEYEISNS